MPHWEQLRSSCSLNDTAPTEIYTLSLHDALPIFRIRGQRSRTPLLPPAAAFEATQTKAVQHDRHAGEGHGRAGDRSEEHTSELQSHVNLVCRLLLEKKKVFLAQPRTARSEKHTAE